MSKLLFAHKRDFKKDKAKDLTFLFTKKKGVS